MEKQNITLSLPKEVIKKAKIIAIEHDMSLSRLLTETLLEMIARKERFDEAKKAHIDLLERGFDMGLKGKIMWSRDELHER